MPYLRTLPDGSLLIKIRVQPRSSRDEVTGLFNDSLKLRLSAPPVDGKANRAVVAFLSKRLHLPKSAITIKTGQHSREKQVIITNCDEKTLRGLLPGAEQGKIIEK